MANHVSAVKRINQTVRRTAVNRQRKGVLRSTLRGFREDLTPETVAQAQTSLAATLSRIDKAAKVGIIHKNAASRLKSRLTKRLNTLAAVNK
jgi:small subunit ribosomal protein S20